MSDNIVRAVAAGTFALGASEAALAQGLRDRGWLVDEVESARHYGARTLAERAERRLRRTQYDARYNADIVAACDRVRPDVLFTVKGSGIRDDTLTALEARGIATVNYFPDYHLTDIAPGAIRAYSAFITTKSFQLDHLRDVRDPKPVHFVHHGYSPLVHRPLRRPSGLAADIAYVGNASPYKAAFLTPLVAANPGAIVRIYGANWEVYRDTPLASAIVGERVSPDYMAEVVATSAINVSLHMGRTASQEWEDLVSTRTFEIPACGGFMLHIDNAEVRSLFDVPGEIDVFATPEELVAKALHYLDHPVDRRAIAARGQARAVPAYSYAARAVEIADIVEPLVEQRRRAT